MKVLHIGDTHLGYKQYRSDIRYQDYFDAFNEAVEKAITEDVSAVIQTGDLFNDRNPSVETLSKCIDILQKLDEANIPVYAIVGNHERKRKKQWLDIISSVKSVNPLSRDPTYVTEDSTKIALYGIDAILPQKWNTTDVSLTEADSSTDHTVLCMHQLFSPPILEESQMDTYQTAPFLSRLNYPIDILSLGDCHHPFGETVNDTYVYYGGATERTDKDQDYACVNMLEFTSDSFEKTQIPIQTARPYESTEITFTEDMTRYNVQEILESADFQKKGVKNPIATITLKGKEIGVTPSDVEQIVRNLGASVVKIYDNREKQTFDSGIEDIQTDMDSIEDELNDSIASLDLSTPIQEVEEIVRDTDSVVDSNVRKEAESVINNKLSTDTEQTTTTTSGDSNEN